jgi:cytidine deaminase
MKKKAFGNNIDFPYFGFRSRHAEMDVLQKMNVKYYKKNHIKIDLYVIRLTKTGELAESKPCKHCIKMLASSGINFKWIYYSTNDKTIIRISFHQLLQMNDYITTGNRK